MTVVATLQREHERERERELAQPCSVCRKIVAVASARFQDTAYSVLGKVSAVLQGGCPHVESLPRAVRLSEPLAEYADREIMARKEKNMTAVHFVIAEVKDEDENVLQEAEHSSGVELLHRPDVPGHAGRGLIADRQWVHWDNVLRWVGQCHSSHKQECQQPRWFAGLPQAVPEWLIDVWNLCLVHQPTAHDASGYAALSYSRGGCESLKTSRRITAWLTQPGALAVDFFASRIPETFRDAIQVTKCLGHRYLWVDALCIVHDDIDSVSKALGEMNLIIASASITIVALTGQGLDFGLRGVPSVSQPRDLKMEVCGLSNGEGLITGPGDDEELSEHSYQNRAWTYPEWLLSRRRLIFRPGSIEWLCQCASWKEHLIHHEQSDAVWRACLERCEIAGHVLKRSPSIWDYSHLTSLFNERVLPTPTDAAKAFSAIQLMMNTVHPGGMNLGLSEFWFEIQLAWSSLGADMERRVADRPAHSPLCALPSWSWLGWQGPVTWPVDCDFQITGPRQTRDQRVGFRRPVTSFSSLSNLADTSTLRPIHSAWLPFRDRVDVAEDRELASAQSGWYMERYDRDLYPYDFNPRGRTLRRVFLNNFRPEKKYKYPVQRNSNISVAMSSRQDPFLVAEMMKVRFQLTDEMLIWSDRDHGRRIRIKETNGGPTVLSLTLPNMRTVESFLDPSTRPATLELIAFAQGWSTWLGDSYNVDPRDCYFVLLIETVNFVSYRIAVGEAQESWWHQNMDEGYTAVVLG